MKSQGKKAQDNPDFKFAVGKSSILRIDWKSWDEFPESGQDIWVVLRLKNGFYPVTGTYFDEVIPASKEGNFPETRWRSVKFHDFGIPEIYVGKHHDANQKRLIAWGVHKGIIRLAKLPENWKPDAPRNG